MFQAPLRKLLLLLLSAGAALSPLETIAADLRPLTQAILASNYQAVDAVLGAGASPNMVDPELKHAPMYLAVAPGGPRDSDIVALLAKRGAQLDAIDPQSQLTPLMAAMIVTEKGPFAVIEGTKANQLVEQLLQLGANPNQALSKGETPLMVAVGLGNVAMVKTLLAGGAEVRARDAQGVTPLHIAYGTGQSQAMIDTLLAAGADPNAKDAQGHTPKPTPPVSTTVPAVTGADTAPAPGVTAPAAAPEKSSVNKWLIGGAVVAAAVIGAVALSKYSEQQKRQKADEAAAAALASAQAQISTSKPPAATPAPLPQTSVPSGAPAKVSPPPPAVVTPSQPVATLSPVPQPTMPTGLDTRTQPLQILKLELIPEQSKPGDTVRVHATVKNTTSFQLPSASWVVTSASGKNYFTGSAQLAANQTIELTSDPLTFGTERPAELKIAFNAGVAKDLANPNSPHTFLALSQALTVPAASATPVPSDPGNKPRPPIGPSISSQPLTVTKLELQPSLPKVGETVKVVATIQNTTTQRFPNAKWAVRDASGKELLSGPLQFAPSQVMEFASPSLGTATEATKTLNLTVTPGAPADASMAMLYGTFVPHGNSVSVPIALANLTQSTPIATPGAPSIQLTEMEPSGLTPINGIRLLRARTEPEKPALGEPYKLIITAQNLGFDIPRADLVVSDAVSLQGFYAAIGNFALPSGRQFELIATLSESAQMSRDVQLVLRPTGTKTWAELPYRLRFSLPANGTEQPGAFPVGLKMIPGSMKEFWSAPYPESAPAIKALNQVNPSRLFLVDVKANFTWFCKSGPLTQAIQLKPSDPRGDGNQLVASLKQEATYGCPEAVLPPSRIAYAVKYRTSPSGTTYVAEQVLPGSLPPQGAPGDLDAEHSLNARDFPAVSFGIRCSGDSSVRTGFSSPGGPCSGDLQNEARSNVCFMEYKNYQTANVAVKLNQCLVSNSTGIYRSQYLPALAESQKQLAQARQNPDPDCPAGYKRSGMIGPCTYVGTKNQPGIYELGGREVNPYTTNSTYETYCLAIASKDHYKIAFTVAGATYFQQSLHNSLAECESRGRAWVAAKGKLEGSYSGPGPGQATGSNSGTGNVLGGGTGTLDKNKLLTQCDLNNYQGPNDNPQFDSFCKNAYINTCLDKATGTQTYAAQTKSVCGLLDNFLKAAGGGTAGGYCGYCR